MADLTTYELEDGIATISMDDGKVNALSIAMLTALHADLDRAVSDGAIVILTGREGYFSAGFDLGGFAAGPDKLIEMLRLGATLTERLLSFPTPVVVASGGHAVAAGAFILLAADTRIGVDGPFKIGLNEVKIGLTVPWFVIELARHRLAPAYFDRSVVTARMFNPAEAAVAGFLDEVVSADALSEAASREAEFLAGLNSEAHLATKLRVRARTLEAMRSAIETELTVEALSGQEPPA